jgi:hypothetical protein
VGVDPQMAKDFQRVVEASKFSIRRSIGGP